MDNYDNIPTELKELHQWVLWKFEIDEKGNSTKIPYQVNGRLAKSDNPDTWASFSDVCANTEKYDGIGIMFDNGLAGIDVDHSVVDGKPSEFAKSIIKHVNSYTEYSPSGNGIHCIVFGKLPDGRRKKDGVEMYDKNRYFTVTGNHIAGTPTTIEKRDLTTIHTMIFGEIESEPVDDGADFFVNILTDEDKEIIEISRHDEKFDHLYLGDWEDYYRSQSEGDLGFCSLLTRLTKDPDQIDRIYRSSTLMRDKWNSLRGRSTYGRTTIDKALAIEEESIKTLPKEKGRFNVHRWSEVIPDPPDIDWVVSGLFSAGSVSLVTAYGGSYKSLSMMIAATKVAIGRDWLNFPVKKCTVLYVDEEAGKNRFWRRLHQIRNGEGVPIDADDNFCYLIMNRLNLTDFTDVSELENLIVEIGAEFVVLDNLVDIMPGGDENAVADVHPIFMRLREIAEKTRAAIVVLHHFNKLGKPRGSSAMGDAVDLSLNITRNSSNDTIITFESDKERDTKRQKFSSKIIFEDNSIRMELTDTITKELVVEGFRKIIVDYLTEHGESLQSTVKRETGIETNDFDNSIKWLKTNRIIVRTDLGGKGSKATIKLVEKSTLRTT